MFTAALERSPEEREAYLADLPDDPALKAEVRALLAAHGSPGGLDRMASQVREAIGPALASRAATLPRIQQILGARYRLLREAGRGGMATVYAAEDAKHGRTVAIKILLPELAATLGLERFSREISILAKLNHPHILTLIDSGEADGLLYYVMPYVEGPSLRARLKSQGPLSVSEAVRIAEHVASALSHAHARGIIHRDVKPENILLAGDQALVTDFGIARAVEKSGSLTGTGLAIGTPAYMSPEQAFAQGDVDHRTDVYALGCVLYEMVAGRTPFEADTPKAVLIKHLADPIPPIRRLAPGIPPFYERAVEKALAKEPDDRFASVEALARALTTQTVVERVQRRLAVLPFVNLSQDPGDEWFADGLTEDVIAQLSTIRALKVISRTSVMIFKKREVGLRDIASQLDVATVLQGSVRRYGDRVRVVAQLIDASTDRHLWAETYDRELPDIFAIQSDVATRIAEALRAEMPSHERERLREHGAPANAPHPRAYEAYLRGRFHLHQHTPEGLTLALRCFEQALEVDPEYTLALGAIADTWGARTHVGLVAPREAYPVVKASCLKAFELDGTRPETNDWVGRLRCWFEWDWRAAEHAYRQAIALNANYPDARMMYAVLLSVMKRWDQAAMQAAKAIELDPLNPLFQWARALQPLFCRHYEEALEQFLKILRLEPGFPIARLGLWTVLHQMGRYDDGLTHLTKYFQGLENQPVVSGLLQAAAGGDYAEALRGAADTLVSQFASRYVPPTIIAQLYAAAGEAARASQWLEEGYRQRDFSMIFVDVHPAWDGLRSTGPFANLLQEMRFPT